MPPLIGEGGLLRHCNNCSGACADTWIRAIEQPGYRVVVVRKGSSYRAGHGRDIQIRVGRGCLSRYIIVMAVIRSIITVTQGQRMAQSWLEPAGGRLRRRGVPFSSKGRWAESSQRHRGGTRWFCRGSPKTSRPEPRSMSPCLEGAVLPPPGLRTCCSRWRSMQAGLVRLAHRLSRVPRYRDCSSQRSGQRPVPPSWAEKGCRLRELHRSRHPSWQFARI